MLGLPQGPDPERAGSPQPENFQEKLAKLLQVLCIEYTKNNCQISVMIVIMA